MPRTGAWKNRGGETARVDPAWNEEGSISAVIDDVREHLPQADVLVIDDGSTDSTAAVARKAGARVASLPFNEGVGAAHQTGYMLALRAGYTVCGHLDGDGQHPAESWRDWLAPSWPERAT